jgi:hypothetical protein
LAWIEFHATRIKRLKKFSDLRKALGWSVHETLGFLGEWWGQTVEVCEDGEVTGWTPDYLSELTGLRPQVSPQVWDELVKNGWIDKTADGRLLIHDWPDHIGHYLRMKYASDSRQKLVEIWGLHGRVYGEKSTRNQHPKPFPTDSQPNPNQIPTLPNLTRPNQTKYKDIGPQQNCVPVSNLQVLKLKTEKNSVNGKSQNGAVKVESPAQADLRLVVKAYKIAAGVDPNDAGWDKLNFSRSAKSAKALLEYFGGAEPTIRCIGDVSQWAEKNRLTWTLETCVKRAHDARHGLLK